MTARWSTVATAAGLVAPDGNTRPTIFAEMTALATAAGAANLGQGFPDTDGPLWVREIARAAILDGANQYPPGRGIPELRSAIAAHQLRHYGITVDPESEVMVSAGATEALTATLLAFVGPGDEVVTLEPFYDSYAAAIAMSGAEHRTVPLRATADGFRLVEADLRAAMSARTRILLINSPHNPTGTVLRPDELRMIADAAQASDAIVVTDEVYEHLTFDGAVHTPLATLPGMAERTISISSAGKTFSLTGWKIGWATGPADLISHVLTVKQFLTYSGGAPLQPAIARALSDGDADIRELRDSLAERRDVLVAGLHTAGFPTSQTEGTYFVCADAKPFLTDATPDGDAFARALPELAGVACVPLSAFCAPGSEAARSVASWVRFTFVKDRSVLDTAIDRLRAFAAE
ncbi:aminotransferase class I/II-fold pyridoxal phosphate-dependent enzyme [Leucobacter tardus]|nr:aminotransferase class I/II-fold pyridoxal phosphate-dependent enzyme [Leucobacter tardus]